MLVNESVVLLSEIQAWCLFYMKEETDRHRQTDIQRYKHITSRFLFVCCCCCCCGGGGGRHRRRRCCCCCCCFLFVCFCLLFVVVILLKRDDVGKETDRRRKLYCLY